MPKGRDVTVENENILRGENPFEVGQPKIMEPENRVMRNSPHPPNLSKLPESNIRNTQVLPPPSSQKLPPGPNIPPLIAGLSGDKKPADRVAESERPVQKNLRAGSGGLRNENTKVCA